MDGSVSSVAAWRRLSRQPAVLRGSTDVVPGLVTGSPRSRHKPLLGVPGDALLSALSPFPGDQRIKYQQ